MRTRILVLVGLLWLTFLPVFLGQAVFGQNPTDPGGQLALVGGTVWVSPGDPPILNGVIVIREGKIVAVGHKGSIRVPRGLQTLDCTGLTITAGFWNSHVHFLERKWANAARIPATELSRQLQDMLTRYGFTSVYDMWSTWKNTRQLRDRIESGEILGPRIRSNGEALVPKGGTPPELVPDVLGFARYRVPEIANEMGALAAATKLLDEGTDGIKLYAQTYSPPIASLPQSAIQAAVTEAHRRGKLAFAHPTSREGLLASVRGGVDVIVHTTPQSGPWDETVLATMKEKRVTLIPTLKLWKYELRHDRIPAQERFVNNGIGQLRAWVAEGGMVLFGTDVGYMSDYDPSEEYALMAEAGMSFPQILASLTTAPAERFGESKQSGRIATGFAADLVVLGGDPSKDVSMFSNVWYTIRGGKVIYDKTK